MLAAVDWIAMTLIGQERSLLVSNALKSLNTCLLICIYIYIYLFACVCVYLKMYMYLSQIKFTLKFYSKLSNLSKMQKIVFLRKTLRMMFWKWIVVLFEIRTLNHFVDDLEVYFRGYNRLPINPSDIYHHHYYYHN